MWEKRGKLQFVAAALAVVGAADLASGQFLFVPESTGDRVMLFSQQDGSLIDQNFINGTGILNTPINAIQVGGEVWVSDQLADGVFRFSPSGTFLGQLNTGGLDNVRGIEWANNRLYVSNAGTANGAPGRAIVMFDQTGQNLGFFSTDVGDPFDVLAVTGIADATDLLVADIAGDDIRKFDFAGAFQGIFHDSDGITGIDFPEQLTQRTNSRILAAGFSAPDGIYEYEVDGTQLNYWAVGTGLRGVHELGNGNIMWTSGSGVFVFDPVGGQSTQVVAGVSARFIEPTSIPEPATLILLGLTGVTLVRRRIA